MRTGSSLVLSAFLVVGLAHLVQAAGPNIVIFIGDGMGFEHVQAGRLYRNGSDATPLPLKHSRTTARR